MNKFLLKLMYAALSAFVLATVTGLTFSLSFGIVLGAGVLLHYIAPAIGSIVLFDTLSPDLLAELKSMREKLSSEFIKADQKAILEKAINDLEEKMKGFINKADVVIMLDEKDNAHKKALDEMSAELEDFRKSGAFGQNKALMSIGKQIEKALSEKTQILVEGEKSFTIKEGGETVKEAMLRIKNTRMNGFENLFQVKANTDPITITGSYSGGNVGLTDFDYTYNRIPQRKPFLRNIMNVRPTSKMYVGWAEQSAITGAAGMVAEGAAKPQNTFTTVEKNERVKKIAKFAKTSKENLDDLPFMASEIRSEIIDAIARKLDEQLLSGDNVGENLKGILKWLNNAQFSIAGVPSLVNQVTAANNYDAIRVAAAYIAVQGKDNFTPNYFLIHPYDAAAMDIAKSTDGIYVIPPYTTLDGQRVAGMLGIENTGMTLDTFIVGDFTRFNLALREDINIAMGYDGNDFTNNLVTILGEMRALAYIKGNDLAAFAYGDFSFIKGQLDATLLSA